MTENDFDLGAKVEGIFGGQPIPVRAVPLLVAGVWRGLSVENDLVEFLACQDGTYYLLPEVDFVLQRIGLGGLNNDVQALLQGLIIYLDVPVVKQECGNMQEDTAALLSWASIFTDFAAVKRKIVKALALHPVQFKSDVSTAEE
jgi:hypothetical protein